MKRRYPQLSEHYTARAHRGIAPRFPTLSADRPRTCPGDLWIWYPFFHIFLFSRPLNALCAGCKKDTLFTRFYWRGWCTGPPPPPPPPGTPGARQSVNACIVLPGACIWNFDTYFTLSPIYITFARFICQNFIPSKILSSNIISLQFHLQC